jgi:hypothetical protein
MYFSQRRIAYGTLRERTGGFLPFVCVKTRQRDKTVGDLALLRNYPT